MAHAGTPTDLAQQPATSTSGLWKTAAAAIAVLALVVGMVIVTSSLVAASKSSVLPAADHRYDQIEDQRGPASLSFSDKSYDQIESQRGAVATSGLTLDRSQDRPVVQRNAVSDKTVGHRGAMIYQ